MPSSNSTTLIEREKADRFGKPRSGGYVLWSRLQGDKLREIKDEQPTAGEIAEEETDTSIEDEFNR